MPSRRSPVRRGGDSTESRRLQQVHAALFEIATSIQGTLDLGEILQRVHSRTLPLLPCDRVLTYRWDAAQGAFQRLAAHRAPGARQEDAGNVDVIPADLVELWIERERRIVVNNIEDQSLAARDWLERLHCTALLGAPLTVNGRLIGGMVAVREESRVRFEPRAVELFEGIARQVAMAMATADLYRTKEEEAQLSGALAEIGCQLMSGVHSADLLNRLCEVTTRVLNCGRSCTVLWEAKERAYVPVAGHGYNAEEWEGLRVLKLPRTRLAQLLTRLECQDVVPVSPAEDAAVAALAAAPSATTSLWMALRRGREVAGIQVATYDAPQTDLPPHYERVGRTLAHLASLAFENARLVEELEQANRSKSDLVATMSHELRGPLSVIAGYTDLVLKETYGPLTAAQAQRLRRVDESARRIIDLINATTHLSRFDVGGPPVTRGLISVADLLAEIDADTQDLQEVSSLRFAWHVPPGMPHIETDRAKLKIVVSNLLGNAIKFTHQGSVTVTAGARHDGVEIAVADTGVGIAPDVLPIIFDPFWQADSSKRRRLGGVGLGLYIVRRMLDVLGGSIEVDSRVGAGSTFRVWVPRTTAGAGNS